MYDPQLFLGQKTPKKFAKKITAEARVSPHPTTWLWLFICFSNFSMYDGKNAVSYWTVRLKMPVCNRVLHIKYAMSLQELLFAMFHLRLWKNVQIPQCVIFWIYIEEFCIYTWLSKKEVDRKVPKASVNWPQAQQEFEEIHLGLLDLVWTSSAY